MDGSSLREVLLISAFLRFSFEVSEEPSVMQLCLCARIFRSKRAEHVFLARRNL